MFAINCLKQIFFFNFEIITFLNQIVYYVKYGENKVFEIYK